MRAPQKSGPSPLSLAFAKFRPALVATLVFSVFCNILMFVGPLYMLQIYDRVLSSRSNSTLIALTVIAGAMLATYAILDLIRSRVLVRAGVRFDQALGAPLFRAALTAALQSRSTNSSQALRDMDQVREFWTGSAVLTLCDAPFAPVFVAVCFLLHPYLGLVALGGALILFALALVNELVTRKSLSAAGKSQIDASNYATSTMRNIEVIQALGMQSAIHNRWAAKHQEVLGWQAAASDRAGLIMASTKFVRQFLQVAILGVGAYLSVQREISPGLMIAASIMMGRALAPVEQAVGQWKGLMATRTAWIRLKALFDAVPPQHERTQLPPPKGAISTEGLVVTAPNRQIPILKGITFQVEPGETIALIGPSAAGKSTLARTLVGAWPIAQGAVRLDGSDLRHYDAERLGRFIGYLPQDVELFAGTISENIARLGQVDDAEVIAAAELAGVNQIIQQLPDGYDTQIGEGGAVLSAGQRQRIGLARAVYGTPNLIVLDEPNASLDQAGDEALTEALKRIKSRGTTIVLVTHKPNLLGVADKVMVLAEGTMKMYGPTEQILAQLRGPRAVPGPTGPKPAEPQPASIAANPSERIALASDTRGAR